MYPLNIETANRIALSILNCKDSYQNEEDYKRMQGILNLSKLDKIAEVLLHFKNLVCLSRATNNDIKFIEHCLGFGVD